MSKQPDQEPIPKVNPNILTDESLLDKLSAVELIIFCKRLGLEDGKIPTLASLERELRLKRGEAGKIERNALRKLRGLNNTPNDPLDTAVKVNSSSDWSRVLGEQEYRENPYEDSVLGFLLDEYADRLEEVENRVTPEVEAETRKMLQEQIESNLSSLTDRERRVVELRFGLEDGQSRTLEEVGQEFGVTRERIRQIESRALFKIRRPARQKKLADLLDEPTDL